LRGFLGPRALVRLVLQATTMGSPETMIHLMRALILGLAATVSVACVAPAPPKGSGSTAPTDTTRADAQPAPNDPSGGDAPAAATATSPETITSVFDSVDKANLQKLLGEITGAVPVTVGGQSYRITERWSPEGKKRFRDYWAQYFTGLGATVQELPFPVVNQVGETEGHNVEAVLPGQSADSVVIILHYDTVGIKGHERENPGADDAGSGIVMQMEAARIFVKQSRHYTIRFVAADYEELTDLAGDAAYVAYLQKEAAAKQFKIVVAANNDQTAWSCWSENGCGANAPAKNSTFLFITCSGDSKNYNYPELVSGMNEILAAHSTMKIDTSCDGSGDTDHYSFWQAGIPAYVVEEYGSENNPHYDDTGDDTLRHIDFDYLFGMSQVNIAFQAKLIGMGP
jgi:hypothetical protein